ncbi:MAG: LysE family translocator [Bacteroidota bacterium]|nr:LysE family translocator [Bacteroidota bacterium]
MIAAFLKGLALGIMLAISVGPIIFSIIKQSINNGYRGGFTFVAGVSASDITLVVVSQLFTELFRSILAYKKPIGIGGSLLLIIIGIFVLFYKKVHINEDGSQKIQMRKRDYVKTFLSGFFMNTLNPGSIAFWLVLATSVVDYTRSYRIVMFATCLTFVLSTDIAKVLLAGRLRQKLTPHNIHIINKISGIILIGFGIALILGTLEFGSKL